MIEDANLLVAAGQLGRGQDVAERPETVEQHGSELDDQDEGEEEDEDETDRLQLEVLLGNDRLPKTPSKYRLLSYRLLCGQ